MQAGQPAPRSLGYQAGRGGATASRLLCCALSPRWSGGAAPCAVLCLPRRPQGPSAAGLATQPPAQYTPHAPRLIMRGCPCPGSGPGSSGPVCLSLGMVRMWHVAWGKGQWPACMGRVRCWVGRAGAWRWAAAAGLAAGAGARLMVCTGPTCRRQAVTSEWLGQGQQQRCVRLGRPALHESTSSARNPPLHLTHTRVTLTTRSGAPAEPRSGRQHPMRVVGLRRAAGMSSKAAAGCWAVTALLPAPADPDATG